MNENKPGSSVVFAAVVVVSQDPVADDSGDVLVST